MNTQKIFTYVSPKTDQKNLPKLFGQLSMSCKSFNTVEELYPLLSDPFYRTDFICISIEMFYGREDKLDMFDIIRTLSTLIKSTVHRSENVTKPKRRNTEIIVLVDETTHPKLIREVMFFPGIASVSWLPKTEEDFPSITEHYRKIVGGDYTPHSKVLNLLKPKSRANKKKDSITLTFRQAQVLQLIKDRGASNKVIAKMLGISESTVKLHIGAILKKYGAKNRTQLAVFSNNLKTKLKSI